MDPIIVVLRSIQNAANDKNSTASMTWDAINRATQAYGAPDIDYERFAQLFDNDPAIQSIVDNFDENGVVIKTNAGSPSPEMMGAKDTGTSMMASAAKHATKLGKG
jgi:hypothetical protein